MDVNPRNKRHLSNITPFGALGRQPPNKYPFNLRAAAFAALKDHGFVQRVDVIADAMRQNRLTVAGRPLTPPVVNPLINPFERRI
ncbi:MAG TPA: hypothetical protein VIC26_06580 [Marinagarivorans sp.]